MKKRNLKEGELICDKCDGKSGSVNGKPSDSLTNAAWVRCSKCQGTGKVDWVENIVGKVQADDMFGGYSLGGTYSVGSDALNPNGIHDDALDIWSKQIADEIDKEILESITNEVEQNDIQVKKQMKKAATVFADMGGVFDNRIISKFMLFFTTKPEVKT